MQAKRGGFTWRSYSWRQATARPESLQAGRATPRACTSCLCNKASCATLLAAHLASKLPPTFLRGRRGRRGPNPGGGGAHAACLGTSTIWWTGPPVLACRVLAKAKTSRKQVTSALLWSCYVSSTGGRNSAARRLASGRKRKLNGCPSRLLVRRMPSKQQSLLASKLPPIWF